jgi:hypothetical protein
MGEKQPAHKNPRQQADETLKQLDDIRLKNKPELLKSSAERAKSPGNQNKTKPEDRKPGLGEAQSAPASIAASHIAAARSAIEAQATSEAALKSDPRYERDQKVLEMGRAGKLGLVPPSDMELAAAGAPQSEIDAAPKDAKEQVADDMQRLKEAEDRAKAGATGTTSNPGGAPVTVGEKKNEPTKGTGAGTSAK